jgi:hypothetical protein
MSTPTKYRTDEVIDRRLRRPTLQAPNHFGNELEGKHFSISRTRYMFAIMQDTRKFASTAILIAMVIVATRAVEAAFEATVADWIPASGPRHVLWRWFIAGLACVAFVGAYFYAGIAHERAVCPEEFAEHDTYRCHSHSGTGRDERNSTVQQTRLPSSHDAAHPGSYHSFVNQHAHSSHGLDGCL